MSLELLKQQYVNCSRCPELCKSRTQVVFGEGNSSADVLLLGEAPGATEDQEGIPFCGMSGKVLTELLQSVGISREEVFITNTILCRPPANRNPTPEEVENCRGRLDKLIELMNPKVIVTIGNFATGRILSKTGIKSLRGRIFSINIGGREIKVVPVIHPANYLYSGRNPEILKQMKADFEAIARVINEQGQQKSLSEY
ncbi:uracil-DNA glycosylase [Candidatus Woesearchaeota archaeon]|nr:uracil-DNA glycosylase [Candidatus Woesearchaeota archaeon]